MQWKHQCSLEWMKARQKYLTASDIYKLLPETKTGRPRKITNEDYLKVYASKLECLDESDTFSTGAAARGHILEPYAVEAANALLHSSGLLKDDEKFYHWDDVVIHQNIVSKQFLLAFSPDALSIPMINNGKVEQLAYDHNDFNNYQMLEIKSYSSEKHLIKIFSDPMQLEERWQIATAMATDKNINYGYLCFYNPKLFDEDLRIYIHTYSRANLANEIKIVHGIIYDFNKAINNITPISIKLGLLSEQDIIEKELQKARLNPNLSGYDGGNYE